MIFIAPFVAQIAAYLASMFLSGGYSIYRITHLSDEANKVAEKLFAGQEVSGLKVYEGDVEGGTLKDGHVIIKESNTHTTEHKKTEYEWKNEYGYNPSTGRHENHARYVPETKSTFTDHKDFEVDHISAFNLRKEDGSIVTVNPDKDTQFVHDVTKKESEEIRKKAGRYYESPPDAGQFTKKFNDTANFFEDGCNKQKYFVLDRGDKVYVIVKDGTCVLVTKEKHQIAMYVFKNSFILSDILIMTLACVLIFFCPIFIFHFWVTRKR